MDLSVIVPIYNTEPWMEECLDSAARAVKGLDAEVILIDDGSTDGSSLIAQRYAETNPQFVYRYKENGGLSRARNFGISLSKGKYLAFLDPDDLIADWLYRDMLELAEKNKTPLTICNASRIDDRGVATVWPLAKKIFKGKPENVTSIRENTNLVYDTPVINKIVLREFWDKHNLSFAEGYVYEDMPVSIRLHWFASAVSVIHRYGYFYRIRQKGDKSITQQVHSQKNKNDRMYQEKDLFSFLNEHSSEPGAGEILLTEQKRLACAAFESRINALYLADRETLEQDIKIIGDFFREKISEEVLDTIPSYHAAKARYIMSGDIDQLIRLVNHKSLAWNTAPVKKFPDGYKMILPEDIYQVSMADASREFQFTNPVTSVTDISLEDSSLVIGLTLYQPRIDLPDPDSQKVSAYCYCDKTGKRYYLETVPVPSPRLTKKKGMKICQDDYRVYRYNYDNAGYRLTVDLKQLIDHGEGPWLICLDYETPVSKGSRILRGVSSAAKKIIDNDLSEIRLTADGDSLVMKVEYDLRQTLMIRIIKD